MLIDNLKGVIVMNSNTRIKRTFFIILSILIPLLLIFFIIIGLFGFDSFYRPLSNVNKFLGNPEIIEQIHVSNRNTDVNIELTDSTFIEKFCDVINSISFKKAESQVFGDESIIDDYYISISYYSGHQIQTFFPKGYLFRGLKDKGIVSPVFYITDMAIFEEWFGRALESMDD